LVRHLPFFQEIVNIIYVLPWPNQSPESCIAPTVFLNIFIIGTNIAFALFSALRGFALWNRNWWLFLFLLAIGLIFPVVDIAIDSRTQTDAFEAPEWGCAQDIYLSETTYQRLIISARISSIVLSIAMLVLTWMRTYGLRKLAAQAEIKASFSTLLLRDGTIYFLIMFAFNITELVWLFLGYAWYPVDAFIGVMQSILISRFMFNLRAVYQCDEQDTPSQEAKSQAVGTLHFASNVAGNMGASLMHSDFTRSDATDEEDDSPVFSADPLKEGLIPDDAVELSPVRDMSRVTSGSDECPRTLEEGNTIEEV